VDNKTVEIQRMVSRFGVKCHDAENAEFIFKIVFITRAEGLILDTLKSYLPAADWLVNNGIEGYFGVRT